ncbi:hypothetical protein [Gorillibacterium sp. CAU 1737]|uniref:hypothetical protein n=1 Tax=Gorillibacterium sp. CAU 1737 TaxID=3140362 RepID=UPI0032611FDB
MNKQVYYLMDGYEYQLGVIASYLDDSICCPSIDRTHLTKSAESADFLFEGW